MGKCKGVGEKLMEFTAGLGHLPTVCDFGQFTSFPEFEFLSP